MREGRREGGGGGSSQFRSSLAICKRDAGLPAPMRKPMSWPIAMPLSALGWVRRRFPALPAPVPTAPAPAARARTDHPDWLASTSSTDRVRGPSLRACRRMPTGSGWGCHCDRCVPTAPPLLRASARPLARPPPPSTNVMSSSELVDRRASGRLPVFRGRRLAGAAMPGRLSRTRPVPSALPPWSPSVSPSVSVSEMTVIDSCRMQRDGIVACVSVWACGRVGV